MKKVWVFIKRLIQSDSKESSKRFIAIYTVLALITYVVIRYTTQENSVVMVGTLCGFVLSIMGVAVWQDVKNKQTQKANEIED